jgi:hypothetical protein
MEQGRGMRRRVPFLRGCLWFGAAFGRRPGPPMLAPSIAVRSLVSKGHSSVDCRAGQSR